MKKNEPTKKRKRRLRVQQYIKLLDRKHQIQQEIEDKEAKILELMEKPEAWVVIGKPKK